MPEVKSRTQRRTRSQKSWHELAPKTKGQRLHLLEKCGSSCFLLPGARKFPICHPVTCTVRRDALLAAQRRAAIWRAKKPQKYNHYERVIRKAERIKRRLKTTHKKHKKSKKAGYCSSSSSTSCSSSFSSSSYSYSS